MSVQQRRERERAERHQLIIDTARELAESDGWDAVTTRRLAEKVEYSQPVLYSHFKGKDAIVRAVAVQGFADLGRQMRDARTTATAPLRALAETYLRFARERPALYDAMFVQRIDIAFGSDETPVELRTSFGEIVAALEPVADGRDLDVLAEAFWSALHGIATLRHGQRLRPDLDEDRLDLVLSAFAPH
ncbi:TetR/AcrR family transcriptional regulator [Nocardia sp. NRRL S-836]|uniref:TetR/AcrR family transcriptional regulator n=1 Tax=Nocardia sp. NRRL S-836 TaxID=1519492 RepID=UPI0006B02539|nr:TetR/AcrR family transcriptional regulator [Nocardia sp. NRRL S-836]